MSLVWMEGFDHEAGETDLQNGVCIPTLGPGSSAGQASYFNVGLSSAGTRFGVGQCATVQSQYALAFIPNTQGFVVPFDSVTFSEGFYGTALYIPTPNIAYFSFFDIPNLMEQVSIKLSYNGSWVVYRGGDGNQTTLGSGTITGFQADAWNYVEFYCKIDPSAGAFIMRVNNVQITSLTGLNTSNNINIYGNTITPSGIFGGMGIGCYNYVTPIGLLRYDDMYFNDTTGSAPYNTFLGNVRIQTAKVNGPGTYTEFTPLTGTNWSQVSETLADGDASYNYSNTVGNKDTFTTTGAIINSTVFGVQITSYVRKDDAINREMANYIISGSTEVAGDSQYLASSYTYLRDVYVADPNTSAPWTSIGVNNLQIGYKLIS